MTEPLKEAQKSGLQEPQPRPSEGSGLGLRPESAVTCPANVSIEKLRAFLFNLKDGLEVDLEVAKHLDSGCRSCELRRKQLYATSRYLQGWLAPKFLAVEEIPPRPGSAKMLEPQAESNRAQPEPRQDAASHERSRAAVCQKLATLLSSPARPLSIERLKELDEDLRSLEDASERQAFADKINSTCDARWRRIDPDLQALAETAAEQLFTALSGGGGSAFSSDGLQSVAHDLRQLPQELRAEDAEQAFLLYMMARPWFLNVNGKTVWDTEQSGPNKQSHIVLNFALLREVLGMEASRSSGEQPRREHAR